MVTPPSKDELVATVMFERFPTYAETLNEAIRPARPLPGRFRRPLPMDELSQARRRRDLNEALHPGESYTDVVPAYRHTA